MLIGQCCLFVRGILLNFSVCFLLAGFCFLFFNLEKVIFSLVRLIVRLI